MYLGTESRCFMVKFYKYIINHAKDKYDGDRLCDELSEFTG